jgi:hypothetical protein
MLARDLMVFSCRIRSGLVIRNDQRLLLVVCIQTNLLGDSLRSRHMFGGAVSSVVFLSAAPASLCFFTIPGDVANFSSAVAPFLLFLVWFNTAHISLSKE